MTTTAVEAKALTARECAALFGVTAETILNWSRTGRFPKPLAISPHKHLFPRAEVERLLTKRLGGHR